MPTAQTANPEAGALPAVLAPSDDFVPRHIGPSPAEQAAMLQALGYASLEDLTDTAVPAAIRLGRELALAGPRTEHAILGELEQLASQNRVLRSCIGMGYYDTITPAVILRNVLENPGWYTQYTPYQAEISQGRMEALVNFQTMVGDLTGLPLSNASLLDEGTAAAEAMNLCQAAAKGKRSKFFVASDCHPQTIAVVQTRAQPLGIEVEVGDPADFEPTAEHFGVLVQYPTSDGRVEDYAALADKVHAQGGLVAAATDLLALTLLRAPGEWGADIAIGSSQRFGVPLGFGGPHAAFFATKDEHKRRMPGRIVGVSKDVSGRPAYRLALQAREQHIKRDRATSNICTAQVLLAVIAGMYGVYHGPEGLKRIARRVRAMTRLFVAGLAKLQVTVTEATRFDTVTVELTEAAAQAVIERAAALGYNLRRVSPTAVGVSLDETTTPADLSALWTAFGDGIAASAEVPDPLELATEQGEALEAEDAGFARSSDFMTHPTFHRYHAEHDMLRYLYRLQQRDLSLTTSMIPLGSCTMKLNATSEMIPVTWPQFGRLHPFAPADQTRGYQALFEQLESWLAEITGFHAISLQPNSGAQGEYAGLLTIRAYHHSRGDTGRTVCLIPLSAHGTNPASAVMAGFKVVPIKCDDLGNIDLADLEAKAEQHQDQLGALMITYPSTHGVFEEEIKQICAIVHERGGQVYLDGANLNAQVGLCRPGDYGADVAHLNLHKTFCIPHGGGGPGMGPIGVVEHLAPFLPGHPLAEVGGDQAIGPVAAAPYGSPSILPISWVYIALMGASGLTQASQVAVLNANYMAHRLKDHYPILYTGRDGCVAHEFIIDLRPFKASAGLTAEDLAKRLMDFGFHAPTMSWPVPNTMMVEPTESESLEELDRYCEAMIAIRAEIKAIEDGALSRDDNPLVNAPHTSEDVAQAEWSRPYSREQAVFPLPWVRDRKFWPSVGRIDNVYGDRNLVCSCPPMEVYSEASAS